MKIVVIVIALMLLISCSKTAKKETIQNTTAQKEKSDDELIKNHIQHNLKMEPESVAWYHDTISVNGKQYIGVNFFDSQEKKYVPLDKFYYDPITKNKFKIGKNDSLISIK